MKHIKRIILVSAIAFVSLNGCRSNSKKADQNRPPNIILIMADDLGAETIGSYGGESYNTPSIDHLAETGIRFDNAYSTPLCTPTRVQLMTGQYPFRNGWTGGIWNKPLKEQFLSPDLFNFAQMLKDAGYTTATAGKWQLARFNDHPNHPEKLGFDEYCLWTWRYKGADSGIRMEGKNKPSRYWSPGIWKNGQLMEDTQGKFGPDIYTQFIIDFISNYQDQPFFVYYPMALTHSPFVPVPGTQGNKDGTKKNPIGQQYFTGMVNYTDKLVGRIVQKITELGIGQNTVVLFIGDNGSPRSITSKCGEETIKGGKSMMNEAGTRVPFIFNWPAVIHKGKISKEFVDLADVLPTFAAIANYTLPDSVVFDGESFLPIIKGEGSMANQWVFSQKGEKWFIRNKNWRLHQDGAFYKMDKRYYPTQLTNGLSEEARDAKQQLLKTVNELLHDDQE